MLNKSGFAFSLAVMVVSGCFDGRNESNARDRSPAPRLRLVEANGDTIYMRSYPYRGIPIPRSVRDSAIAAITASEGPPAAPFQSLARQWMPAVYSPVERLTLGLDSTVWVDLRPNSEGAVTIILDQDGQRIGTVLVPAHSRIRQASRSHLWVTETDGHGLASVVRYRVTGWPL